MLRGTQNDRTWLETLRAQRKVKAVNCSMCHDVLGAGYVLETLQSNVALEAQSL